MSLLPDKRIVNTGVSDQLVEGTSDVGRQHGEAMVMYVVHQILWLAIAYFLLYLIYILLAPGIYRMRYWGGPFYWGRSLDVPNHHGGHEREETMDRLTATVDEALTKRR